MSALWSAVVWEDRDSRMELGQKEKHVCVSYQQGKVCCVSGTWNTQNWSQNLKRDTAGVMMWSTFACYSNRILARSYCCQFIPIT